MNKTVFVFLGSLSFFMSIATAATLNDGERVYDPETKRWYIVQAPRPQGRAARPPTTYWLIPEGENEFLREPGPNDRAVSIEAADRLYRSATPRLGRAAPRPQPQTVFDGAGNPSEVVGYNAQGKLLLKPMNGGDMTEIPRDTLKKDFAQSSLTSKNYAALKVGRKVFFDRKLPDIIVTEPGDIVGIYPDGAILVKASDGAFVKIPAAEANTLGLEGSEIGAEIIPGRKSLLIGQEFFDGKGIKRRLLAVAPDGSLITEPVMPPDYKGRKIALSRIPREAYKQLALTNPELGLSANSKADNKVSIGTKVYMGPTHQEVIYTVEGITPEGGLVLGSTVGSGNYLQLSPEQAKGVRLQPAGTRTTTTGESDHAP